jgi:hypothetical protein
MNLNYVGSVAERFMKFRSTLTTEEDVSENLFNAVSIYVPKSLASANLASGSYEPSEITADKYAVIPVTVDNYTSVLADGSVLLSQWLPVFNDGTNSAVTLYLIVFDDTDFAPTVTAGAVTWAPLSKAFKELYFISFFKTIFSEHYDGKKVESDPAHETDYDDSNYFDMALALSYLCENESTLSFCLLETQVVVPSDGETDTNACKILSKTRGEETQHCTTLLGSTVADRAEYFWGYLLLIGFTHSNLIVHNGYYMIPIVLGKWFEDMNVTGQYIGNKLAKIRLSGTKVKPTGNPSPLNEDVNLNLDSAISDILDDKNVGYFISIADNSLNNAELVRERSGSNFPITAYMISKWIDYQTAQDVAKFATATLTLTKPVLVNKKTYSAIQSMLVGNIQTFAGLGRLENLVLDFPPYSEAKQGQWFKGTGVWSATYIDDLEGVEISGSITF